MTIRANFQTNYLYRYLIMAAVCLGGAAWFAYDGFIGYPADLPASEAYAKIREIEDADVRAAQWKEIVEENGWEKAVPEKTPGEIRADIQGQYIYGAVALLAGIPALLYFFNCRGTWIESTEKGLKSSWGQEFDFSTVTQLDKKRWAKKGIARATYSQDGQTKVFVFDDFKYDRDELGKILRQLEATVPREAITGGPTELETDAERELNEEESESEVDGGSEGNS
ncbi:MAG: hypothetical protein AAF483_30080 [Planctomycetota bacterium]